MDKNTEKKALEALERQEKRYSRQNDWIKNNYDRVSVTLPRGTKERIQSLGGSVNSFCTAAILAELDRREQ